MADISPLAFSPERDLRSFGRRKGRALPERQQRLVEEVLPALYPDHSQLATLRAAGTQCWLEIGFGAGEHLHHLAASYPQKHFIGVEPYLNGVAKLLVALNEKPCENLSLICDDVRPWMESLPSSSLDGVYILFPDPWPKRSQRKRRLINHRLLDRLARIIRPSGILRIATDHVDYSAWIMEHLQSRPEFQWSPKCHADWSQPFESWCETRYQHKTSAQGRLPIFLEFTRV